MDAKGLLLAWQRHHGALSPQHRALFLTRPEVEQIIEYSNAAINSYLPYHRRLRQLLQRLRSDGRTAVKKTPPKPRADTSLRATPRKLENLQPDSGLRSLKRPNNPNPEKTKTKKDRASRSERDELRGIAQSKKWWE